MTPEQTFLSTSDAVRHLKNAGFAVSINQVRRWVRAGRFGSGVRRLPNGRAQIPASALDQIVSGTPTA